MWRSASLGASPFGLLRCAQLLRAGSTAVRNCLWPPFTARLRLVKFLRLARLISRTGCALTRIEAGHTNAGTALSPVITLLLRKSHQLLSAFLKIFLGKRECFGC